MIPRGDIPAHLLELAAVLNMENTFIALVNNPFVTSSVRSLNSVSFVITLTRLIISLGLVIGGLLFMYTLILGSIQWISAGGNKASIEAARAKVMNALVGLFLLFGVFALITFVEIFFNTDLTYFQFNRFQLK